MSQATLTVVGNVATDPIMRRTMDGTSVASFRLASTERKFDKATGEWVDGETLFISVSCWRRLAEGVQTALSKGDPVVVVGKVYTRNFEFEGQTRITTDMTATAVGPDLSRCTVTLERQPRRPYEPAAGMEEGAEVDAAAA